MTLCTAVTETDSLLLTFWEGVLPWSFHIVLIVLLVAFRGFWAERAAEAVFIFRCRLENLERGKKERRERKLFISEFWRLLSIWRTMLNQTRRASDSARRETAALEMDTALNAMLANMHCGEPLFRDTPAASALARGIERCQAAVGEREISALETLEKFLLSEIAPAMEK